MPQAITSALDACLPLMPRLQMNGADPYSALHTQQQQQLQPASFPSGGAGAISPSVAATPSPTAATNGGAATERRGAAAQNAGYPIMDKHTKPLVGSDTSKAVRCFQSTGGINKTRIGGMHARPCQRTVLRSDRYPRISSTRT